MNIFQKFGAPIAIIFFIIAVYFSQNFKLDASSDTLILKSDEDFQFFEFYNEIFTSQNFLILAIKNLKGEIDHDYINNINVLKKKLENIKGVESTFSIVDAPILLLNNQSLSDLANQEIENINTTDLKLKLVLDEFRNSPIFQDQIINKKADLSSIIIYLKKNTEFDLIKKQKKTNPDINHIKQNYNLLKYQNNKEKDILIKNIRNIITKDQSDYEYFLGGIDMITNDAIAFIKNDVIVFSVSVIVFIIFILFIIYRDIKWVIIPLSSSIFAVTFMTGFIGMMNWEITAISSNFISLMLILSISMNIHIINDYQLNYSDHKITNKIKHTLKNMFLPCLYTSLTTVVAFGSLLFSDIKPIIDFGQIMIVALFFMLLTSFTILPLIISFVTKVNKTRSIKFNILNKFANFSVKQTNTIFAINIILVFISLVGINKLTVENSFINYFKSNTEIFRGMELIDRELGGTTPIDIIISFNDEDIIIQTNKIEEVDSLNNDNEDLDLDEDLFLEDDLFENNLTKSWFDEEKINTIKKIHNFLESKEEIGKVQSLENLIEMANLINKKTLSIFELSVLYNEIPDQYKKTLIAPYLSVENNMIKISARVKDSFEINRNNLIIDIDTYVKENFNNIKEVKVNGLLVLYNNMLQSLFSSQVKSFGIILLSIFVMFIILFQSIKLSLISIIPNIIASTFIIGLIGILGIPLDIMTITIAAITIGIAVDNTIHYIYRIKENSKRESKIENLIKDTHNKVGYAVLTTSLTIAFGFSVLSLSNFIPTIFFGIFTAIAMIIAMLGVLLTLPAIIFRYKP